MLNIGIAATAIGLIIGYSTVTHAINDPYSIPLDTDSTSTIIIHIQNVLIAHGLSPHFSPAQIRELMLGLEQLRSIGGGIVVGQGYMTVQTDYDALAEFVRNNPPYWGHANSLPQIDANSVQHIIEELRRTHGYEIQQTLVRDPSILYNQVILQDVLRGITNRIVQIGFTEAANLSALNPTASFAFGTNAVALPGGWVGLGQTFGLGINYVGSSLGNFLVEPIHNIRLSFQGLATYFPVYGAGFEIPVLTDLPAVDATPVANDVVENLLDNYNSSGGESKN